jgi:hypothetical protein
MSTVFTLTHAAGFTLTHAAGFTLTHAAGFTLTHAAGFTLTHAAGRLTPRGAVCPGTAQPLGLDVRAAVPAVSRRRRGPGPAGESRGSGWPLTAV